MIKIIADTTSCLDPEFARLHGIPIIPQVINFGNQSFYEGVDIDMKGFMQRLRTSTELPKTAAPPPELFVQAFQKFVPENATILCILPSEEVSGTVRSAKIAAMEFPEAQIHVVDTRTIAGPLGTMVQLAAGWAREGVPIEQIVSNLHSLSRRCRLYFLVDTLEYLVRGGRIGGAAALLGGMLQIKPILRLNDGRVDQFERERTHRRALARLIEIVHQQYPQGKPGYLTVLYSGEIYSEAEVLAEKLGSMVNQTDVPILYLPPAIVTHGGPGILAAGFFVAE